LHADAAGLHRDAANLRSDEGSLHDYAGSADILSAMSAAGANNLAI
jgi:hypothetical protein